MNTITKPAEKIDITKLKPEPLFFLRLVGNKLTGSENKSRRPNAALFDYCENIFLFEK